MAINKNAVKDSILLWGAAILAILLFFGTNYLFETARVKSKFFIYESAIAILLVGYQLVRLCKQSLWLWMAFAAWILLRTECYRLIVLPHFSTSIPIVSMPIEIFLVLWLFIKLFTRKTSQTEPA